MKLSGTTCYDRWYWLILLAFVAGLPVIGWGAFQAGQTHNNNIQKWLPDDFEESINHQRFLSYFGSDEFVLVSWEGCTLDDPRIPSFAELVRRHTVPEEEGAEIAADNEQLFARVTTGPELLDDLMAEPLELPREEALERLYGLIVGRESRITGTIVVLSEKGDEDRVATVKRLAELAVTELGIPAPDLRMVGDAVTNAAVDLESESAIQGLLAAAGLIALTMAILSLRSFRLLTVVLVVAIFCYVWSEAMVYYLDFSSFSRFFGGKMNLVLVVMPVLVYVLTMSAGVHLVNYYRDAAAESSMLGAPAEAIDHGWIPCTLAAGTTAVGVGSLAVSSIQPVRDFGSYSAVGILISLAALFLLLPALLVFFDKLWIRLRGGRVPNWPHGEGELLSERSSWVDRIGAALVHRHTVTSTVCLLVLLFFAAGAAQVRTDLNPRKFFDAKHRLNLDYAWLGENIGPHTPIEIVVEFDAAESRLNLYDQYELVAEVEERVRQTDEIRATLSPTTFRPSRDKVDSELEEDRVVLRGVANKRLDENRTRLADSLLLAEDGDVRLWRISCRSRGLEGNEGFDEIYKAVRGEVERFFAERTRQYEERKRLIAEKSAENRRKLETWFAEKQQTLADQPDELAKHARQRELSLEDIARQERLALADLDNPNTGITHMVTGMVPLFYVAQNELFESLVYSFALAFGLIAVLMVILLKSTRAGLLSMLPNVFPVAVIFGAMGWWGRTIDIGSMMTASVAMGIAVDDTVHFLTWFRRGMHDGMTRPAAVRHAYRRCAMAMIQTTAIAGLSLLVFGMSHFQPVSQFGTLMFLLLIGALVGDLVFLPALLAGRAGSLFEEKHSQATVAPQPQPAEV